MDLEERFRGEGAGEALAGALARELRAVELEERGGPLAARVIAAASPETLARLAATDDPGARAAVRALAVLSGASESFADALRREPHLLLELAHAGAAPPTPATLADSFARELAPVPAGSVAAEAAALARAHRRALLAIGYRDHVLDAPVSDIARELADLAAATLEAALARATLRLRQRFPGLPPEPLPFVILGLGKLGGHELNYSSDVDLIFCHDERLDLGEERARVERQALCERLGAYTIELASALTPEGPLYRVDMRLRPHGERGSLAPGVRAALRYYEEHGRTWERLALLKARPVAGDLSLGERLLDALAPFVFRRYLSANAIADIKDVKRRIEEKARAQPFRDVKIGPGGIRDIEMPVQFLQLLYGPDLPEVRLAGSLEAIAALVETGSLDPADGAAMTQAYTFLRKVEHRLQTLAMRQTHALPPDPGGERDLARRMGYLGPDGATRFLADLEAHARRAQSALGRLLHGVFREAAEGLDGEATELILDPAPPADKRDRVLSAYGFSDPEAAYRALVRLGQDRGRYRDATPRTRAALASVAPRLLRALGEGPDPQAALVRFERAAATLGAKAVFFDLVEHERDALTLFTRLASESVFLNELLVTNQGLFDEVLDLLLTREPIDVGRVRARVAERDGTGPSGAASATRLDALCEVHRQTLLLIGLRDLGGRANLVNVQEELTALAEATLEELTVLALASAAEREGPAPADSAFAVLGLGKLGGRELGYGSDLDLVCTYDPGASASAAAARNAARSLFTRAGQRLQRLAEEDTRLYAVDQRLRPGGQNAPIVVAFDVLLEHYRTRAEVWERLAATKLRFVAGARAAGEALVARIEEALYAAPPPGLAAETLAMRQRLEDSAKGPGDLKRAAGGLVDLELLVAYLKLEARGEPREVRAPGVVAALHALSQAGHLPAAAYADLLTGYQLLRKVEARLRIVDGRPVSELPTDPAALRALARRLGYVDTPREPAERALDVELRYHRRQIRRRFLEVVRA